MGTAEMLRLLADRGADQPEGSPRDLLRRIGTRVLLGVETQGAAGSLQKQAAALAPSGNLERDVFNWTRYAAILELLGVSAQRFAATALAYFESQTDLDRDDRDVTECCLALSILASADASATPHWVQAAKSMPARDSASEGFLYEPLFLATHGAELDAESLRFPASLTARLLFEDITGAPHNSAAPAVCAFAALARRLGAAVRGLLWERAGAIDEIAGAFDKPRIRFKTPVLRAESPRVLEMRVAAAGEGELDTGIYPVEPITWLFGSSLARDFHREDIHTVLTEPASSFVVKLLLPKAVSMAPHSESFLRLRSAFSWESVCAKLPDIRCAHRFMAERK